jgi:hypothetical protein
LIEEIVMLYRALAILLAAVAADAAVASMHGSTVVVACGAGATALSILSVALLWNRPAAAAALNALWLAAAFAVSIVLGGGPNAAALAFTAVNAGLSAALGFCIAIVVAGILSIASMHSRGMRIAVAVVCVCAVVASLVVVPRWQQSAIGTSAGAGAAADSGPSSMVASEAARLGANVDGLLARVSDKVAYEIYPGVFRGATATLVDGAGNDLDKALLLHDLMRAANPSANVRFASCTLSAQQADTLIAAAQGAYRAPVTLAQIADKAAPRAPNAQTRAFLQKQAALWSELLAQDRDESSRLLSTLQGANAPLKTLSAGDMHPAVAQHTWLQLQTGTTWTNLDPTLPHAKAGASLCDAQSTAPELSPMQYDTVTARVRVERRNNGMVDDRTAVEGTWRTSQLAGASLSFAFAEPAAFQIAGSPAPIPTGTVAFTPVLRAAGTNVSGEPLVMPSLIHVSGSAGSSAAKSASQANEMFGTAAPTATPQTQATDTGLPEVVGAWLQVTVNAAGVKPESIESTIFDRIAFADRAAGKASSVSLPPLDDAHGAYLPFAALWNIGINTGSAVAGAGDGGRFDPKSDDTDNLIHALGSIQRTYYAFRQSLFGAINTSKALPVENVQPGISLFAATWEANGAAPSPALLMDVSSDHAVPEGAQPAQAVQWGVSSLVAERLLTNGPTMFAAAAIGRPFSQIPGRDVLGVFDLAQHNSVGAALVHSGGDLAASVPADAKARLATSLQDGSVAFAPSSVVDLGAGPDYGWWIIAPDGALRDEMQSGRHQDMPEEGVQVEEDVVEEAPPLRKTGILVKCAALIIGAAGVMASGMGGEGMEAGEQEAEIMHALYEAGENEQEIEEIGSHCE